VRQAKSYLTADNQMTRKPNLARNTEIESSGRAANSAGPKDSRPRVPPKRLSKLGASDSGNPEGRFWCIMRHQWLG